MPSPTLRRKFPPFLFSKTHTTPASGNPESTAARWSFRRLCFNTVLALSLPLAMATTAMAQSTPTLSWNSNPESDIAGYIVHLGTVSGNYSVAQDVGTATSYAFVGLSSATVYYCAVQAYNSAGIRSGISTEISFSPQSATDVFNTWAATSGLSGTAAAPSAIPFQDGVKNVLKYAFNMNAGAADTRTLNEGNGTAGLPVFSVDQSKSPPSFTVEFIKRKGSGLVYTPKSSSDLITFQSMNETQTVTSIDATWERVKIEKSVNTVTTPRLFGIVEVTLP